MFNAYQIIEKHGVSEARKFAANKAEYACLKAAAAMLDSKEIVAKPVFANPLVSSLPYREPQEQGAPMTHWERRIGANSFKLESGFYDNGKAVGLPYGSKGRIGFVHICSRMIELGTNILDINPILPRFIKHYGMQGGGMTYKMVTDQLLRLTSCRFSKISEDSSDFSALLADKFTYQDGSSSCTRRYGTTAQSSKQIIFNQQISEYIFSNSVGLHPLALQIIGDNSWAIDVYIWLAGKLPGLSSPVTIEWKTLEMNFGMHYKQPAQFKLTFSKALQLVVAIYPQANVKLGKQGIILYPGCAPV